MLRVLSTKSLRSRISLFKAVRVSVGEEAGLFVLVIMGIMYHGKCLTVKNKKKSF